MSDTLPCAIDAGGIAARIAARRRADEVLVVGLTGSVAAGKSTLAGLISAALLPRHRVETVSTDGFLLANQTLDARGLTLRKGFPESYDLPALAAALDGIRTGPTLFPGYSHISYDVDPALARVIDPPDILLVEGLALSPLPDRRSPAEALDLLIYLDASEADLEYWFIDRFLGFRAAAADDPASFYARFRGMSEADARALARSIWTGINLPNLRDNISLARDSAGLLLLKARDHRLTLLRDG